MTSIYCDHCGVQSVISDEDNERVLEVKILQYEIKDTLGNKKPFKVHLCEECFEEFKAFLTVGELAVVLRLKRNKK